MKPIHFEEANKDLLKPNSMTDKKCGSLPVWTNNKQCISCWKMSFKDKIRAILFGKVWLSVLSGQTQPPVSLTIEKSMFEKKVDEKNRIN